MSTDDDKGTVVSLSGSPIYRHGEAAPFAVPRGEECLEEISSHIEAHLGKIFVKPHPEFPFVRLVTSGMSDLPMTVPPDADVPRFAELLITLPENWRLDEASMKDERWYWPIRLLKMLARLPHKHATWLGFGHTVPNGDPAEPYAPNTRLSGAIVLPSVTVPDAFHQLRIDADKEITFFAVVPLYDDEMNLKLREGTDALLDRFERHRVDDIVDPERRSVARKPFGPF